MTLGIHADGLIYLFVDGNPTGTGIAVSSGGDVVGYVDENNNIVISGNLPDGSYSVKYELDDGSSVNIGQLVIDDNVYYTVTNALSNCVNNNTASQVTGGSSYYATITANSGYTLDSVEVTMGGDAVPVTNGVIDIGNVTGNIIITAVAVESVEGYTNLADPSSADWQEGYRLSISGGTTSALAGHTTTNYIPCEKGDVLRVKGLRITGFDGNASEGTNAAKVVAFNSSKTKLGGLYGLTSGTPVTDRFGSQVSTSGDVSAYTIMCRNDGTQTSITGIAYIRIDGFLMDGYTSEDVIITINEEIT